MLLWQRPDVRDPRGARSRNGAASRFLLAPHIGCGISFAANKVGTDNSTPIRRR
jgi:hypothetical protein